MKKYKPLAGDIVMLARVGHLTEKINGTYNLDKLKDYHRHGKRFVYKPHGDKLLCVLKFLYSNDSFIVAKEDVRGVL